MRVNETMRVQKRLRHRRTCSLVDIKALSLTLRADREDQSILCTYAFPLGAYRSSGYNARTVVLYE